jgi:hypothetical protein
MAEWPGPMDCNDRFALQSSGTDPCPCPAVGAAWAPEALQMASETAGNPASL